jgi:DNA-binding NtrC family response regulator
MRGEKMHLFGKLKGLKTLLIDDSEVIRETMKLVYSYHGCSIKVVATAEDGLRAIAEERFDMIICDFRLPGINGMEFFKQAVETQPDTIRVLITGYGNQETIMEAFDVGVHVFMRKPFSLIAFVERLLPHVDKYLKGKLEPPETTQKKTAYNAGGRSDLSEIREDQKLLNNDSSSSSCSRLVITGASD